MIILRNVILKREVALRLHFGFEGRPAGFCARAVERISPTSMREGQERFNCHEVDHSATLTWKVGKRGVHRAQAIRRFPSHETVDALLGLPTQEPTLTSTVRQLAIAMCAEDACSLESDPVMPWARAALQSLAEWSSYPRWMSAPLTLRSANIHSWRTQIDLDGGDRESAAYLEVELDEVQRVPTGAEGGKTPEARATAFLTLTSSTWNPAEHHGAAGQGRLRIRLSPEVTGELRRCLWHERSKSAVAATAIEAAAMGIQARPRMHPDARHAMREGLLDLLDRYQLRERRVRRTLLEMH